MYHFLIFSYDEIFDYFVIIEQTYNGIILIWDVVYTNNIYGIWYIGWLAICSISNFENKKKLNEFTFSLFYFYYKWIKK